MCAKSGIIPFNWLYAYLTLILSMLHSFVAISAITFYLLAAFSLLQHLRLTTRSALPKLFLASMVLALLSHIATLHLGLFKDHLLHLNFYNVSPLIFFVVNAVLMASLYKRLAVENVVLTVLPLTALSIAFAAWIPAASTKIITEPGIITHLVLSIIAYSLMTIAAMQALMLTTQEHALKKHRLHSLIRFFPPLQTMEKLLFQILLVGFVLLSFSILSGFIFLDDMFAQHLAHKTILSIVAWLAFAVLLYGHFAKGWRGNLATYWVLGSFALLMLAYFGSKFVLEIILHRV